tara:strand:- start:11814 stop:12053 length:240 start_codon:yes stop_codon:yes gene_type:complete
MHQSDDYLHYSGTISNYNGDRQASAKVKWATYAAEGKLLWAMMWRVVVYGLVWFGDYLGHHNGDVPDYVLAMASMWSRI